MIKFSKAQKMIFAVTIQIIIIAILIISKYLIFTGGTDILLRIEPVDPRDPLRGDYITFSYTDMSLIPSWRFDYEYSIKQGDVVYVPLDAGYLWDDTKYGPIYTPENYISKNKPKGGLYIKGVVEEDFRSKGDSYSGMFGESKIKIKYGIEEYFIPEGEGQLRNFGIDDIYARVSVDKNGESVLKQIYIDDEPWP